MLLTDDSTMAVEVPVYLTPEDVAYFQSRGFNLDFEPALITGHIDILQIRNGSVYILDYKPEARKQKRAHVQLTIYALALSPRANIPLEKITCIWFDELDSFHLRPHQTVSSKPTDTSNGSQARIQSPNLGRGEIPAKGQ